MVIQFYEIKREKQRKRRNRERKFEMEIEMEESGLQKHNLTAYKIMAVVTLVSFGVIVRKLLL